MYPLIKSKSCQIFGLLEKPLCIFGSITLLLTNFPPNSTFQKLFLIIEFKDWASLLLGSFSVFTRAFDCAVYVAELERTSQNPSSPSPGRWPSEHSLRSKRSTPTSWRACTPWAASETRTNWPKICCLRSEWQSRDEGAKSHLQNHTWSRLKGWEALRRRREIY